MRDGLLRREVKRVALVCFAIRLRMSRWQRRSVGAIPYDLGGSCQGCGTCCEAPAIRVGRATWYLPTLRRLFLWWHQTVNGFALQSTNSGERTFVFACAHFDWDARRCDSYESRPGMCRDYPRALLDQPAPLLFPKCGYRALASNRVELVRILESQDLGAERLAKLRKGLYLEED